LPLTIQDTQIHPCTTIVYIQTSKKTIVGSLQAKGIRTHDFTDSHLDILINNLGTSQTMYYVHSNPSAIGISKE
jgi:hypothetical protein